MIPVCLISQVPAKFEEKIKEKALAHVKNAAEAAKELLREPETVFIFPVKEESEAMEFLTQFLKKAPSAKIVLLAGPKLPAFETQAMAAGAADVLSEDLSFPELLKRIEKVAKHSKAQPADSILIVDDDQGVRNFLSLVFKKKGFDTILAESGKQAIEAVRSGAPSVVLLDMMMPEMNGLETLKKLREIKPNLGVVMATGLCDESLAQQSMQLGAYAYVVKPFDLPYLEMVVLTRLCLAA